MSIESADVALDRYATPSARRDSADVELHLSRDPAPACTVTHTLTIDGRALLTYGRADARYILRTDELATFVIEAGGDHVTCHPERDCPLPTLAALFVDRVVPAVLDAMGRTALHGSAVAFADLGAIAFVGDTGAGKSTLAAALSPPALFLSDDCVALHESDDEGLVVAPSYAFARLHPTSARELGAAESVPTTPLRATKLRAARTASDEPEPLRAIYALERGSAIAITEMSTRDAMVCIAKHIFRVAPTDRQRLLSELDRLEDLVRRVRVARLAYPHRFDAIDDVGQALRDDLVSFSSRRPAP